MAGSFGRTFKPSFLSPGRIVRPGKPRRTLSQSSDLSSASASSNASRSEDPFMFSAGNTPAIEEPGPALPAFNSATPTGPTVAQDDKHRTNPTAAPTYLSRAETDSARLKRSRPIAIEIPALRKVNTAPSYTPPEQPLSARGDIPGGYFPLHEDPKSRVHRPHPFHADVTRARQHSITKAVESSASGSPAQSENISAYRTMSDQSVPSNVPSTTISRSHTPVSSYIPSGVHDNALPMGKYYPSNYENRSRSNSSQPRSSAATPTLSSSQGSLRPDVLTAKTRTTSSHSRSDSDAKRRLQQYQRDMIAQATLAASQVLVSADQSQSTNLVASSAKLGAPVKNIQLGTTIMRTAKPASPKLVPLGSPGPVTPMDLEGGDSYLNLGRAVANPDAIRQAEEVARVVRAGEEQRRREQATSPRAGVSSI